MSQRPGERELIALLTTERRGPRRNGIFAAWLVLRAAIDYGTGGVVTDRNHRQRLQAIRSRLGSLTLPDQLRPSLTGILDTLADAHTTQVPDLLEQLRLVVKQLVNDEAARAIRIAIDAGEDSPVSTTL